MLIFCMLPLNLFHLGADHKLRNAIVGMECHMTVHTFIVILGGGGVQKMLILLRDVIYELPLISMVQRVSDS